MVSSRMRVRDPARTAASLAVIWILAAVTPAVVALFVALATETDPARAVRLVVTAIVYAVVAAVSTRLARPDVAAVTGALAVTSGILALLVVLSNARADGFAASLLPTITLVSRVPEVAALALLPWLVASAPTRGRRPGLILGLAAVGVAVVVSTTALLAPVPLWLHLLPLILAIVSFALGAATLWRRWRAAGPRQRTASTWFAFGAVLLIASYIRVIVPLPVPLAPLADAAFALAQGFLPLGILLAIATGRADVLPSPRLIEQLAAAQSLAFGVSAYLAVTSAGTLLSLGPALTGALSAAALAFVLGGTLRAARARLTQVLADIVPDARSVLARLADRLTERPAHLDARIASAAMVASSLRETWRVDAVEIRMTDADAGGGADLDVVSAGEPGPFRRDVPLQVGGVEIGVLSVSHRSLEHLDRTVGPVLAQIAGFLAVAVQLARVNEEAVQTRRRAQGVRREERHRLAVELHDELAPTLAGLVYAMVATDAVLATPGPGGRDALALLRQHAVRATEVVRSAARSLLPTALDQGDLAGALDELAARTGADTALAVNVRAPRVDLLEPDLQLALYLLVSDVVSHAVRNGASGHAAIEIGIGDAVVSERHAATVRISLPDGIDAASSLFVRRVRELGGTAVGDSPLEAVIPR
ncbi:histidine kinase [Microbacterium sp. ET2]|uniref:histidine kinase n=1 Tax=Microbacterium albipurpureum TaxID=3050384 RepID=UPI00259CD70D|nr:histidine kinase [Microbacterium sp. ET2 (Ac-2212)]WJL94801.1 histidine kinase [Microbacterium sp. ET2 (Ac-2212)]